MPYFLVLPIALAALIWAYVYFNRTGLLGVCVATMIAGSCLGHPFFHVSLLTLDRVLLGLGVVIYATLRLQRQLPPRRLRKLDVVLCVFAACLIGSTFMSDWRYSDARPVSQLLFFYLMPFAMYWLMSRCRVSEQAYRWIIGTFSAFGVYLSLTAICEVMGISSLVFPRYIMSPDVVEFLGRGRGPFLNPVGNGMYLSAALLCTLMWWPLVRPARRPLIAAIAGLICVGAVCTLTRSVWLGVAVSIVGTATFIVPTQHRLRVLLVAALAGGMALAVSGTALSKFKRDKHVSAEAMAESAKLRPILAAYAFEMFRDNPLTGVGLAQYKQHNLQYLTSREFDLPMEQAKTYVQHNIFLSLLVETGLIGMLIFVTLLLLIVWHGWTLWYAFELPLWQRQIGLLNVMLLAAYLPNGMFHEMSVIPMLNMLLFFFAGLGRNMRDEMAHRVAMEPTFVRRQADLPI